MTTIIDVLKIPTQLDGRRRISDEQRQEVRRLYEIEGMSINKIYKEVGISKRSVQFILFPERYEKVKARAKEVKRWEPYNTKDYRRPVMQKHRAKKRELLERGDITVTAEAANKYQQILDNRSKQARSKRSLAAKQK